jgi:hypothetical protein
MPSAARKLKKVVQERIFTKMTGCSEFKNHIRITVILADSQNLNGFLKAQITVYQKIQCHYNRSLTILEASRSNLGR